MASWFNGKTALAVVASAQGLTALAILRFGHTGPIAMHFDLSGHVDLWGDRADAALVVASVAGVTLAGGLAMDALARRRGAENPASLAEARGLLMLVTSLACGLIAALAFQLIAAPDGGGSGMMAIVAGLLTATGAYLGKVGPNPLIGIRTPWTFASRLAWDKANRLAGRLLFWGGLVALASTPFAAQPAGFQVLLAGAIAIAAIVVFESWRVWRTDPDRRAAF
jgi:uncharacterized membrane protein